MKFGMSSGGIFNRGVKGGIKKPNFEKFVERCAGSGNIKKSLADLDNDLENKEIKNKINSLCPRTGRTPLTAAAKEGNIPIIELLLRNGANLMQKDGHQKTPLEAATDSDTKKFIEKQLQPEQYDAPGL